jgi:transposase
VGTCAEETSAIDSLGRRTGPWRQHTIEEKLRIVQETHVRGASVATVARRHNVNPNQVFAWRQLYRRGLLDPHAAQDSPPLLPVKIGTPTLVPMPQDDSSLKRARGERSSGVIEIELSNGHRIRVQGGVDAKALKRVIAVLVRR